MVMIIVVPDSNSNFIMKHVGKVKIVITYFVIMATLSCNRDNLLMLSSYTVRKICEISLYITIGAS
jgi:hypothetical protein